jgi:hypothetical protein
MKTSFLFVFTLLAMCSAQLSVAQIIPADRRINWNPGIPGGIPNRTTIFKTIDAAKYGNGTTDATTVLQNALNDCLVNQVVYLPAGTYSITSALQIRKGIVLRGAGPDKTKIIYSGIVDNNSRPVIIIGGPGNYDDKTAVSVVSGYSKGSTSITVSNASAFKVGDVALIDQLDDASVPTGNCDWFKRKESDGKTRSIGQIVEITAKNSNTLTLATPLYWNYSASLSPQLVLPGNWVGPPTNAVLGTTKYAGVEDLHVSKGLGSNITMVFAAYCWIKNVESYMCAGRSITMQSCYRSVLRDSYVHDSPFYYTGGGSYGLSLSTHTSDCLVENNIIMHFNLVSVMENTGGGNVIGYNYMDNAYNGENPTFQQPSFDTHCSMPYMELIEGNYGASFSADNVHGGSKYLTFFRNYASGKPKDITVNTCWGFFFEAKNHYLNIVGNIILSPTVPTPIVYDGYCDSNGSLVFFTGGRNTPDGMDPYDACPYSGKWYERDMDVWNTMLRHGNYDQSNKKIIWDPNVTDHNIPNSLYLTSKPAFMGSNTWPWVDPTTGTIHTLPARKRYDGASPTKIDKIENETGLYCFPNPFDESTTISYSLSEPGMVNITLYDINGRKVVVLVNEVQNSGPHSLVWNGTGANKNKLKDGIYFCKLKVQNELLSTQKILLTGKR